jgi:uncharacterized protein (TIGR01777 family)
MKILFFGGTGFIGKHLIPLLLKEGHELTLFSGRANPGITDRRIELIKWDAASPVLPAELFAGEYGIINLAGENIGSRRWTGRQKNKILLSRVLVAEAISEAISKAPVMPKFIIQASAVGYYGSQGDALIDESSVKGKGFLADVVNSWEEALNPVKKAGSRIIFLRTAPVLGPNGGVLPQLMLPFQLFFGGHLGNGRQWFPWIHITDAVSGIMFLLRNEKANGIYNLSAPEPVRNREFAEFAAKAINRPCWFHIPSIILRAALTERADELLLTSQRVVSRRLTEAGFEFRFKNIKMALNDLFN